MASFDLISSSFKAAWNAVGSATALVPSANIYYGRPQQPEGVAGFPYLALKISQTENAQRTVVGDLDTLVTYELEIEAYTCQGQAAGATTGDQVIDQGNIQRQLEAILNRITPNNPWQSVTNFLHCLKDSISAPFKDEELYLGKDVYRSIQSWEILIVE